MVTVVCYYNITAGASVACFCLSGQQHNLDLAFAKHWGFTPLPTKPYSPQENGKQAALGGLLQAQRLPQGLRLPPVPE